MAKIYRASPAAYKKWLKTLTFINVVYALAILPGLIYRSGVLVALSVYVVSVGLAYLLVTIALKRGRITITDSQLIYRRFIGTRRFELSDMKGILVNYAGISTTVTPRPIPLVILYLETKAEKKGVRINSGFWDLADLKAIAQAAGAQDLLSKGVLDIKAVNKLHPSFAQFGETHFVAFVAILSVVSLVVIVGVIAAIIIIFKL